MKTFQRAHPLVLCAYFLSILLLTMFQRHWLFVCISFICALVTWYMVDKSALFKEYKYLLLFLMIIIITNPLFVMEGVDILYQNDYLTITSQALVYGLVFGILLLAMLIWFKILKTYISDTHLVYLFGRTLPILGVVISMSLRLTTKFTEQYQHIKEANQCIYENKNIVSKSKQQLDIFMILITWAFESSIDMMDSMHARGYGSTQRSHFHLFIFTVTDFWLLIAIFLLDSICIYGYLQYYHGFYYYPIMKATTFYIRDILYYGSYVLLLLFPLIFQLGGLQNVSSTKSNI